jgi:hypothetical protein
MGASKRAAVVLATVAAFGVGLIAYPGSAAAAPPPVLPLCTPKPSSGSDSCVRLKVTGKGTLGVSAAAGVQAPFEPIRLGFRTTAAFDPANSEWKTVILRFDDDITFNLAGVPGTCPAAQLAGDNIATAWVDCGPGAGGVNTYLSTALGPNVSGVASTTVAGIDACTMAFKGATTNQILLYLRFPIGSPSTECNNPATNTGGSATVILTGTLSNLAPASPYGTQLTVPNVNVVNPTLDDFYASVERGAIFQARCPAGEDPHLLQGTFSYTAPGDATDNIPPPPNYAGTFDGCSPATP